LPASPDILRMTRFVTIKSKYSFRLPHFYTDKLSISETTVVQSTYNYAKITPRLILTIQLSNPTVMG